MSMKTGFSVLSIVVGVAVTIEFFNGTKPKHPYADLKIEQLVETYGYPLETHEVVTQDGYIITLHRIPHGPQGSTRNRIPVLFMHGFLQSARDFVNMGPSNALSFQLVDHGFDVWLGNARGTTNSRKHTVFNPDKDEEYWNYSMDEIGLYDVPAFIDHILEVTQQEQLHYVGYSQGTMVFFMMGSERPQYMQKIKLMTALAPAVFLKDPIGPFLGVSKHFTQPLKVLLKLFNMNSVFTENSLGSRYLRQICNENSIFVELCLQTTFLLHGYNHAQVNKSQLSLIFSNTPAGASSKQLVQINQFMQSGEFQRYDLGTENNLKRYKSEEPPHYDLSKVEAPVALYYAKNDYTINEKNMERVVRSLPNVVKIHRVGSEDFNHNDFINAKDVTDLLYTKVVEEILKF